MRSQAVRRNTAPDRTGPPKLGEGSPQPCQTMGSPDTTPLWVRIRNSAATPPPYRAKARRDNFYPTALDPQTPENYRTGPKEIKEESPQSFQTMGSMVRFFSRSYDIVECFLWLLRLTASAAGLLHEV